MLAFRLAAQIYPIFSRLLMKKIVKNILSMTILLFPALSYAEKPPTIEDVIRGENKKYGIKALLKFNKTFDTTCAKRAYDLYAKSRNIPLAKRMYVNSEEHAIGYLLGLVIAHNNLPVSKLLEMSKSEISFIDNGGKKPFFTSDATAVLQANRGIACSIEYALSEKVTDPYTIVNAMGFFSYTYKIFMSQETTWRSYPATREKEDKPYRNLHKRMRYADCKITDNYQALKVIDNFNRKYIIDGFSNLDAKMFELANKSCRVMISTSAGLTCSDGVCK